MDPSRLQLLNESELVGEASIEEQCDVEVECEVFHLLQGDWILEESDPPVRVSVRGRRVEYSDGRLNQELSRAARPCASRGYRMGDWAGSITCETPIIVHFTTETFFRALTTGFASSPGIRDE